MFASSIRTFESDYLMYKVTMYSDGQAIRQSFFNTAEEATYSTRTNYRRLPSRISFCIEPHQVDVPKQFLNAWTMGSELTF